MTMHTTQTNGHARSRRTAPQAPATANAAIHTPLAPLPDQSQIWLTHGSKPITFDEAMGTILRAREEDGARADQVADLRAWGFGSSDGRTMQIMQTVGHDFGASAPAPISLRRMAFGQLCERVRVPAGYVATLPPKLQIACMNWAMSHGEAGTALVRRAGGDARAIVSDRYAAFDDDVLLQIVDDALKASGYRSDAMVRASVVGPHMTLRISIPSGGVEVKRGDVIEWGVDFGNSEVGLRSVQVVPMTYRLICTNGMRSAEGGAATRLRHVGDPMKIREDLIQVVPTAFAEARGDLQKWRDSVDDLIDDALNDIEGLRSFGLTQGEQRAIGRTLAALPETTSNDELAAQLRNMRTTTYDVANAITQTARDRTDVGARLSLEETAHRYLTRKVG